MKGKGPIFIGGFMRSGTTLLRYLLDSHPNISCGPETVQFIPELRKLTDSVLSSQTFKDTLGNFLLDEDEFYRIVAREPISAFFTPLCKQHNKQRWATKTPSNILHFDFLARAFPDAYFIHVIRDGRDCVSSLNNVKWWGDPLTNPVSFINTAKRWAEYVTTGIHNGKNLRYMEVKYESLTENPKKELMRILDFIGEEWNEDMLQHEKREYTHEALVDPRNQSGAGRPIEKQITNWKDKLTAKQTYRFSQVAGELLHQLGYETLTNQPKGNSYKLEEFKTPINIRVEHWYLKLTGKI